MYKQKFINNFKLLFSFTKIFKKQKKKFKVKLGIEKVI